MQNPFQFIALGTAAIGRPAYINIKTETPKPFNYAEFWQAGWAMLESAYSLGLRHFDTAPGYGLAEKLLIEWIRTKNDPSIEVSTKWGYTYVADFKPDPPVHELKEHSLAKLKEQWAVSQSLQPNLSIYQIHSATLDSGVLENSAVLEYLFNLKTEENIAIGLSTSGAKQSDIIKAAEDIHFNGKQIFEYYQITYNVFEQSIAELVKNNTAFGQKIIIKEALANGRIFRNSNYPMYEKTYKIIEQLAQKYDVGPDAIALRFCIDSLKPYRVLSGAAVIEHLESNLKAVTFELDENEIELLQSLSISPESYWNERKQLTWN